MSGGHFRYKQYEVTEFLSVLTEDKVIRRRFPRLVLLFNKMHPVLQWVFHDIDWDLSGDSEIRDDLAFEHSVVSRFKEALKGSGEK